MQYGVVLTGLLLSTGLFMIASTFQLARAQTNSTGLFGSSANFQNKIVKEGSHIVDQITKGGAGFLNSIAANITNARPHFDAIYQDIVKDNKTGADTQLKQLYAHFFNDSETAYGLGQELNQLAQSKSAQIDSHTKQIIAAIGTDLKDIALGYGKSNSTSNTTGVSNSTKLK